MRLRATNPGEEAVRAVASAVSFQHRTVAGAVVDVPAGTARDWDLTLPASPPRGTTPAVATLTVDGIDVLPLVIAVTSPDAPPSPVRATLTVPDIAGSGTASLKLENTDATAIAGRVFFLLPAGMRAAPESQGTVVPGGGEVRVPFVIDAAGADPGAGYRVYSVLEFQRGGAHHTAIGEGTLRVHSGGRPGRARPLVIGALMLLAAVGGIAFASIVARRRARERHVRS